MKKGKRQIMEKNVFAQDTATNNQDTTDPQSTFQNNFTSEPISKPTSRQEDSPSSKVINKYRPQPTSFSTQSQVASQKQQQLSEISTSRASEPINSMAVSRTTKVQLQNLKSEEQNSVTKQQKGGVKEPVDEKKSRIQMLKQKYLKKVPETKTIAQNEEVITPKPIERVIAAQESPQKPTLPKTEAQLKQSVSKIKSTEQPLQTKIQVSKPQQKKNQDQQKRILRQKEQQIVPKTIKKEEEVNQQQITTNEVKESIYVKLPQRKSKVPPPPPPNYSKKSKILPPKEQKEDSVQINVPVTSVQSTQNYEVKQNVQIITTKVKGPPPPPNKQSPTKSNTIQQILAKRLKKENKVPQKQLQNLELEQPAQPIKKEVPIKLESIEMPQDEQYLTQEKHQVNVHTQNQSIDQSVPKFDNLEGIRVWCEDSQQPLCKLLPSSNKIVQLIYRKQEPKQLIFTSKNPTFNPIINRLIQQFVLRGKGELTEGQKVVLNELALQFFYSDLKSLTTSFFILLVKLGKTYLKKYKQFFRNGVKKYILSLIEYGYCFVEGELANFVQFLLEENLRDEEDYFLIILLGYTQSLATSFANTQINDPKNLVLMVVACQHIYRSNKNIIGLYLQLISQLITNFAHETILLESVLKYLNKLETHDKYYQLQKQLKLKLINNISRGQSKEQQRTGEIRNNQKKGENSGLMGFWSKAVDKIKSATTQIAQKEKPTQEEPQEDITYDPVTKRYLVNGKAFQDQQGSKRDQNAPKLPPNPPPPKPVRQNGSPLPPGNKKPRTVTAVNRYA